MFEAVIFDWDGTLADTRAAIVSSFQLTLREVNIQIPDSYIERRMGIGASETFREILKDSGRSVDEALIKQLVEQKSRQQVNLKGQVQLFPGALDLLEALHCKRKIGLASMNSHMVINELIKAKNLNRFFQTVTTAEDVTHSKPHPEIFLKCAQQLNSSPQECVVVEDSLFGVKAAKAAGMSCIGVTTGAYSRNELEAENPTLIVSTLKSKKVLKFILS